MSFASDNSDQALSDHSEEAMMNSSEERATKRARVDIKNFDDVDLSETRGKARTATWRIRCLEASLSASI